MAKDVKARKSAALATPTDLGANATKDLTGGLNILLADVYSLYIKTKNFHWHMSGPHFRDYHLLLDDQATEIDAMTDVIAERVRKLGGGTIRSIGHIKRLQRVLDNDADFVTPLDMLAELRDDNIQLTKHMRSLHEVCDEHNDVATASLLDRCGARSVKNASPSPARAVSGMARRPASWRRASPDAAGRARVRRPADRRHRAPRGMAGRCRRHARPTPAP